MDSWYPERRKRGLEKEEESSRRRAKATTRDRGGQILERVAREEEGTVGQMGTAGHTSLVRRRFVIFQCMCWMGWGC